MTEYSTLLDQQLRLLGRIELLECIESVWISISSDGSGYITAWGSHRYSDESTIALWDNLKEMQRVIVMLYLLDDEDLEHYVKRKI